MKGHRSAGMGDASRHIKNMVRMGLPEAGSGEGGWGGTEVKPVFRESNPGGASGRCRPHREITSHL